MSALAFPLLIGTISPVVAGTFRALFPEFRTADDTLVQSRLDQAAVQIDTDVWGDRAGEGQAYLAAHLLATAPGGMFARLASEKGESTYGARYKELAIIVAGLRFRVI